MRIPYSLEIEDKLPRGMPYPHQVADQIAADMIASGQVRMQTWELLCDILPNEDPRREACTNHPGSMCFMSGAYSQGPLYGLRRNTTLLPRVSLLVCKYIRSCTRVPFTSFVLQRNTLMRAHRTSTMPRTAAMWYYLAHPLQEEASGCNPPQAIAPPWMALCMDL